MPVEVSLELVSREDVVLPHFTGHISRGLFLHILRQVDPALSFYLHQPNVRKPYSVTPLIFRSKKKTKERESFTIHSSHFCIVTLFQSSKLILGYFCKVIVSFSRIFTKNIG